MTQIPALRQDAAPDLTLDVRGLVCPLPILRARKALREAPVGSLLELLATDPGAPSDFEAFCRLSGHALEASSSENGVFRFLIRRGGE